jgi:hypothetical protein
MMVTNDRHRMGIVCRMLRHVEFSGGPANKGDSCYSDRVLWTSDSEAIDDFKSGRV